MPLLQRFAALCVAVLTALPGPLAAQEEDVLCNGKYAFAAEMLDAAYAPRGTLYSGSGMVGAGASLDLWRLLVGKPDYNFRAGDDMFKVLYHRIDPPGGLWDGGLSPGWVQFAFDKLLPYATAPNDQAEYPGPRVWVRVILDYLALTGPSPDWWLDPVQRAGLTPAQALIADTAAQQDLVDWMLGVVIQARLPGTISRGTDHGRGPQTSFTLNHPALKVLEQHYWQRFEQSGGIEWATLAVLLSSSPDAVTRAKTIRVDWEAAVRDCSAGPAEYVAFAASYYDSEQQNIFSTPFPPADAPYRMLPPTMQARLIESEAFQLLARETATYRTDDTFQDNWQPLSTIREEPGGELDRARAAIATLPKPEYGEIRAAQVLRLLADDLADLGAVIRDYGLGYGNADLLAMLSAEDLFTLAKDRPQSDQFRWRTDDDKAALARAAFLRFLALGQDDRAFEALELLIATDDRLGNMFDKYRAMDAPLEVRLALFALDVPQLTLRVMPWNAYREVDVPEPWVWVRHGYYSPDLPDWVRSGAPVQRAVGMYLRTGRFWYAVKSDRQYRRGTPWGLSSPLEPEFAAFPPRGPYVSGVPFGKLVALDELARLGPETGLTQRLSEIIIGWADKGSDTWPEMAVAQLGPMPEALARIIRLNRYRTVGAVDGIFAGERAFHLLHDRFGAGKAARKTPVWWKCTGLTCDR